MDVLPFTGVPFDGPGLIFATLFRRVQRRGRKEGGFRWLTPIYTRLPVLQYPLNVKPIIYHFFIKI